MSNSLLLKISIIAIINIIFITGSFGLEIGISPAHIKYDMKKDVSMCKELEIYSSKPIRLTLMDKWSSKDSRNYEEYNLKADEFSLTSDYPEQIEIKRTKKVKICLSGKKEGQYNGLIEFDSLNEKLNIGIWTEVNIAGGGARSFDAISGETVREEQTNRLNMPLLVANMILLIALAVILMKSKRKEEDEWE